ncbi:serine hydrolase [Streptomyces sp. NPDC091217]|uniref:serine hydrolase n=1 Tax=Streptomyces sp. NPDC091217 TaxID=3365975 RepID=UPI0037F5B980
MVDDEIQEIFERSGCEGAMLVRSAADGAEFGLRADELVVPASVIKVLVALEAETRFADGSLDPRERVALGGADRTPGPVGLSLFEDDVTMSWRDMVVLMLTISDNPCTDALIRRLGTDTLNTTARRLGLHDTVVQSDLMDMLDSMGQDLGHTGWLDLLSWSAGASPDEAARVDEALPTTRALDPEKDTRTTPRDMVTLLGALWSGQAGPAAACARVRAVMARQLTKHRIATGFRPPARVAAKSGSLVGVVRNEIGVITYPDDRQYLAAVFTRSRPGADDFAINTAIGTATARAVAHLEGCRQPSA